MALPGQPDPRTDEALVAAADAGDASAFAALYYRHRDWVVRLAYRVTGDADLSLDVLQDVFAYLLARFPGFRLTAGLRTYLYPFVRHIAIERQRKARRFTAADGEFDRLPAPETRRTDAADTDLAVVLATLPEGQREVLLLRFVDGMSLHAIAAALALPLGTVKSRLHNALATLREDARTRRFFLEGR